MALLDATSFLYDGQDSSAYGLKIGWFDGDSSNELDSGLEIELQRGEMNMVRTEPNQYGVTHTDTLSFEFAVFHPNGDNFSFEESRAINNWLRKSNTYKMLQFNGSIPEDIVYYAICTNIVDVVYSGHNGKKLTFVCNSPFGFSQNHKKKIVSSGETVETSIYNFSDNGIYYPDVKIEASSSYTDTIRFENETDGKVAVISFANVQSNGTLKVINMDSKLSRLTDVNDNLIPAYKIGWDNVENIYWFRLLENKNKIRLTGNCTVTVSCTFPRKVGEI